MSLPHLTAVFIGGQAFRLAEALGKIAGRGKAHQLADLRQTVTGVAQHIFAFLNSAAVQIGDRRDAILFLEGMGQIVFVDVGEFGKCFQRDSFAVVAVQIPRELHTLPAVGAGRFLYLQRTRGTPPQPDEPHFQQILPDRFAAVQPADAPKPAEAPKAVAPVPAKPAEAPKPAPAPAASAPVEAHKPKIRFCDQCGAKITSETAKFCAECGNKLIK